MSTVCRFITVAALLLHLIFGCSLHHAAACGHHDHDGCKHACSPTDSQSVDEEHACGHDHDHGCARENTSSEEETGGVSHNVSGLVASCCVSHSQPCDGNHPGCHGIVECSFVLSSDIVFIIDAPLIAYVTFEHDPMMSLVSSMAKLASFQRSVRLAKDSLSHCASLCTWVI